MAKAVKHPTKKSAKKEKQETESSLESHETNGWVIRHLDSESAHYDDSLNQKMLDYLDGLGLITNEQKTAIIGAYRNSGENVIDVISQLDIMKVDEIGRAIAEYFNVSYANLKNLRVSPETVLLIPEEVSKNEGALSYAEDKNGIYVAMVNPSDQHLLHLLEKKTGKKTIAQFSTPAQIRSVQQIYRQDNMKGFQHLIDRATENIDKLATLNNISTIFDTVVLMAYYRGASDIHIEPFEDEIRIRLRVDGVLSNIAKLPTSFLDTMVNHVKVLSKLRTDEHNSSQDGRFKITSGNAAINFRVSILPSYYGEKVVLRLLSSESQEMSLEELGYSKADIKVIESNIHKTQGMNLITGPTGSGKTTTLYSLLSELNKDEVNISTIEDPIEYGLYGMTQVQVNLKTNLTFSDGLRSLLRQDPDIMMIGEIRDLDTAKISAHASLTGHLILATLHTSNAALAPLRLVQMGLDPYLIISTLNLIVAQRLTRAICTSCMVTYVLSSAEINDIESKYFTKEHEQAIFKSRFKLKNGRTLRLYKGNGCEECGNSGYRGRTVVAEVMEINQVIRDLILSEASREEIEKAAVKNGMTTMLEDGLAKVFDGRTTLEELFRVLNQ